MNELLNLSSTEIGTKIDEKEKALSEALKAYYLIEQEKLLLQREILEKQTKKKDLEIALSKAGHLVRQVNIELKLMKSAFWSARNSGI